MITFKQFLKEAPLHDYQTIGDFERNSSFRDPRDRRIIQHPKAIERVRKKFGNTEFDFDFYFVNSPKANKHTEVGLVSREWVMTNLGSEVYNAISKNLEQDHIQVIFTNNKGSQKVPLTAWMMAHRIGHALARQQGSRNSHTQYMHASDHLISQLSEILKYYSYGRGSFDYPHYPTTERGLTRYSYDGNDNTPRKNQLAMKNFFQNVCTFKSARDKRIRDWFEVLNELIAQYLTTGKIKFNKAPRSFGSGSSFGNRREYYCNAEGLEDVNDLLDMLARDMQTLIDDILGSVTNGILVM